MSTIQWMIASHDSVMSIRSMMIGTLADPRRQIVIMLDTNLSGAHIRFSRQLAILRWHIVNGFNVALMIRYSRCIQHACSQGSKAKNWRPCRREG